MALIYKRVGVKDDFWIDLLIINQLVIEVKSIQCIHTIHVAQMLTYRKLGGSVLG